MGCAIWEPNWGQAVAALQDAGALPETETDELKTAYEFLRRCESVLRRFENTSLSMLPVEPNQQRLFAQRLGMETLEEFRERYDAARETIHRLYLRRIQTQTGR
jgi:glutamine synthetase adenylyltransferase